MKLTFIVAAIVIGVAPLLAQAQPKKPTKADAQKVVDLVRADKDKTQTYCDLVKIGEQMEQADQNRDNRKADQLALQMDVMSQRLGSEYVALVDALQELDPDSREGQEISATLEALDRLCPK